MRSKIVVALAGNPNSGKTTVFNNLTGARQHIGNYPGVTVERKEGLRRHNGFEMRIVDLPGTYSLTAYSAEELVARDFILGSRRFLPSEGAAPTAPPTEHPRSGERTTQPLDLTSQASERGRLHPASPVEGATRAPITAEPDVVVNIIDSSNLERNLYLTVQLMETGVPLILVFNMSDEAKTRGYEFDIDQFSRFFATPVVETVGHKGKGMDELLDAIAYLAGAEAQPPNGPAIHYGQEIEDEFAKIEGLLRKNGNQADSRTLRWIALKLLENDKEVTAQVNSSVINEQIEKSAARIETILGDPPETAIAAARYGFISGVCQEAVRSTIEIRHTRSDRIDSFVTNRLLGIPIFLGLMYLVFSLTFTLGEPVMGWIESLFGWLGGFVQSWWPEGSESALKSLLVDGVIGGVGGVVVFLPNILLLFLAIAILEDSGYMARAAFIVDRLMHKIGLHGKSFIPMLIGFGCSVPAIMATRTLENGRDRLTTMLVTPLMSCGARLPIYALIIPAFFPQAWHGPMLWTIYIIGILLAVASAKLLRTTIFKGESIPFVMELPPYRVPTLKGLLIHMWERGWLYLRKAGTVILGISILLWAMTSFPGLPDSETTRFHEERRAIEAGNLTEARQKEAAATIDNREAEERLRYSIAGRVGRAMEPIIKPMGFDWKTGTALIGAFAAKEVFVAQMGIVHSIGEGDGMSETLRDTLKKTYTPLIGFCIMLFCLIGTPCMATIAVTARESGSWKWAMLQLLGLTALAYVITVLVFQIGSLINIGQELL